MLKFGRLFGITLKLQFTELAATGANLDFVG